MKFPIDSTFSIKIEYFEQFEDRNYVYCNYEQLIGSFATILAQGSDHDYQGDSIVAVQHHNGLYGLVIFGWGSCSGCDALQACNSIGELAELAEYIEGRTMWFDTFEELVEHVHNKDWEGTWLNKFEDGCVTRFKESWNKYIG